MTAKPVDPDKTFLIKIEDTPYGAVVKKADKYAVFLYSYGLKGSFHHSIVLRAKKHDLGFLTLELILDKKDDIVTAVSRMFREEVSELEAMGEIEGTLEDIAIKAMDVLIGMGAYNVVNNNCQTFCNGFLAAVGLGDCEYLTTSEWVKGVSGVGLHLLGEHSLARSVCDGELDDMFTLGFDIKNAACSVYDIFSS